MLGDAHSSAAMMPILAMGRDVPNGRMSIKGDRLELDWSTKPSKAYYADLRRSLESLAGELDGKLLRNRLELCHRAVTVHAVGGCPMSVDAARGVVDPWGEVHGYAGLWVADGSVMPGPVGPNPSFTIAALADRFSDVMLGAPRLVPKPAANAGRR
jgi:cholesterol oxidase